VAAFQLSPWRAAAGEEEGKAVIEVLQETDETKQGNKS